MSKLGGYFKEDNQDEGEDKMTIGYCRVSSHDQKDDLQRQIKRVEKYCHKFDINLHSHKRQDIVV